LRSTLLRDPMRLTSIYRVSPVKPSCMFITAALSIDEAQRIDFKFPSKIGQCI